jgi:hypothetical protein
VYDDCPSTVFTVQREINFKLNLYIIFYEQPELKEHASDYLMIFKNSLKGTINLCPHIQVFYKPESKTYG